MEILSVTQVQPNFGESAPLVLGMLVICVLIGMLVSAYCHNQQINNTTIGVTIIGIGVTMAYIILGLMKTLPIEAKVKINDVSVQEYQEIVAELDKYSLEGDILTIRMSEQDFYRWYYERHEATISASSSSSIESKNE